MADVMDKDILMDGMMEPEAGMVQDIPAQDSPALTPANAVNIAESLSEEKLKEIGEKVVLEFDQDLASRSDWDKRRANWLKLFSGFRDAKNFPWDNCSNVHIPLMGIASLQFQARAYEALIPSRGIAKCWSTDGKSIDQAARAEKYLNYQLSYEMDEWEEEMDILLLQLPIFGSAYKKTYYDPILKRNVSRTLGVDEFVTPYKCKRIEEAERKTHVLPPMSLNELKKREKAGLYINVEGLGEGGIDKKDAPEYQKRADEITGITENPLAEDRPRKVLEQHRLLDLDGDGIQEPYIVTVDYETRKVLRIVSRLYEDAATGKQATQEFFTAYTFIPNPESHYGFGFGHLLEGLNEASNTLINQLIDAGTLSNTACGFVSKRAGIKKGDIKVNMGKFVEVDSMMDDLNKSVFQFKFPEPSQSLFALLGLLNSYAKEISSVSEGMMGKLPSSDTPATSMLAVMEQGMKVFSTIHKRIHRAFRRELQKLSFLNSLYLEEEVYFMVQDSTSKEMDTYQSGRADFADTINVIPVSDPNITSRAEKLTKAQQVYQFVMTNPLTSGDNEIIMEATMGVYEAMEVQNAVKLLPKKEDTQPPDLPPQEENAGFIKEVGAVALPQQNQQAHMDAHGAFMASMFGQQLTPHGKKLIEAHHRDHLAFMYLQFEQENQQMLAAQMMGGMDVPGMQFGGDTGMEAQPFDQGIPQIPGAEGMQPA